MTDKPEVADPTEPKRFRWGCVVIGLFLLPLLYFLSVPFIWKAVLKGCIPSSIPATIYRPIAWLSEIAPSVNKFYEWYFSFFGDSWFEYPP